MYVRTKKGEIFDCYESEQMHKPIYYPKKSKTNGYIDYEDVYKKSDNLIDILQVGDLVRLFMEDNLDKEDTNIFEVIAITSDKKEIGVFTKDCELDFYPIENLRGIVTHEQFSQMEYIIEE